MSDLQTLVDGADDAALLAAVDGLCASRQWDALADLAQRCRDAVEVGRQLWGVAMHIDYRLAWEGPPAHAAAALTPGAGRFALGPLTEVAASTHTWEELAPHLTDPVIAAAVAQERVIRGEDLTSKASEVLTELPLVLADWEPQYALPRYRDRTARFPAPAAAAELTGTARPLPASARLPVDAGAHALGETVRAWTSESTGAADVIVGEGAPEAVIGALAREAVIAPIAPADALALLQWAGASGGAKGRRPGGASGRFAAWWSAAALSGLDWPDTPDRAFADALGEAIAELQWLRWRRPEAERGWFLRLAITDPDDNLAWAIEATDAADESSDATPEEPA